jgi:hypothetical protein
MRPLLAVLVALAALPLPSAAAECKKAATGKPIYRQQREALHVPRGEKAPPPTEVLSIYPDGSWTWTDDPGASGCVAPAAMKEVTRALARARFRLQGGIVTTCAALPTHRMTYAAPRRGKRITVDAPCGNPVDTTTTALIACVEAARQVPPPADADLRAICRGA